MSSELLTLLGAIVGIVLVDLALSGDNALVIGVAAAALPGAQRRTAILMGGAAAIILRILFAILATFLLQLPFLQAIGGAVLLFIAVRLLLDRKKEEKYAKDEATEVTGQTGQAESEHTQRRKKNKAPSARTTLRGALLTIVVADVTMSLDNILAIGALATSTANETNAIISLVIGLLLSIAIVLAGSALVALLMDRLPWLLDVAALVLAWTAGNMFLHDKQVGPYLNALPGPSLIIPIVIAALFLAVDGGIFWYQRTHTRRLAA